MPDNLPSRLGPYEILAPLGAGGMGRVYRARDPRLGREVALKVLPDEVSQDKSRRERFQQEARSASALNHPNIACTYDIGSDQGMLYVVSELVEGESLRALIGRGPVPMAKLMDIAVQLADGIAAAHFAGLVHRDLKPENILLTRNGRVKIIDFGLAKRIDSRASGPRESAETALMTEPGTIMGTAGYMAPEQVRAEAADHRADLFSLGVILYEMATGKPPFHGNSVVEVMHAVLADDPPPLPSAVPRDLDIIIRRCLEKPPERRFQTAADLEFALGRVRDSLGGAPKRSGRPRWLVPALAGGAVMLAAAALGGIIFLSSRLRAPAAPENKPAAKAAVTLPPARQTEPPSPAPEAVKPPAPKPSVPKRSEPSPAPPPPQAAASTAPPEIPAPLPPAIAERAKSIATAVAKSLAEGRYQDAAQDFDDNLRATVTPDGMRQSWESPSRQRMGEVVWIGPPLAHDNSEFIWIEFQRGIIDLRVNFGSAGKVSAIYYFFYNSGELKIDPAPQPNLALARQADDQGEALFRQNRYEDARKSFDRAIQNNPGYAEAYRGRCAALDRLAQYAQALMDCTHAMHLKPDDVQVYKWRGDASAGFKRWDVALASWDEAVRLKPDNDVFHNQRAWGYFNRFQYDRCVAEASQGIALSRANGALWLNRSSCYEHLQKYELAAEDMTQVVNLTRDARDFNRRGSLYNEAKQYRRALADFNEAIRLKPDYKDAYNNRGFAKDMLGDSAGAAADRKYARDLP